MPINAAFGPLNNGSTGIEPSITVAGSVTSATSAAFTALQQQQMSFNQILVSNTTAVWAYVNFGPLATVSAATVAASMPIAPNTQRVFTVDPTVNAATVILASGTGNVIFTRGEGM